MESQAVTLTPVRVRGKRGAQRPVKVKRERPSDIDEQASSAADARPPSKRRKRPLTGLESLPLELLEIIFLQSGNFDLPLVSAPLVSQLSGDPARHLHKELVNLALTPILLVTHMPDEHEISVLESVLTRRFCTWDLFNGWLHAHMPDCDPPLDFSPYALLVRRLIRVERLPRFVQVPSKLLHGPWTEQKLEYLTCCMTINEKDFGSCPDYYRYRDATDASERARISSWNGISDAIREQQLRALHLLIRMGAIPESDFLHVAIMDEGCNMDIVEHLFAATADIQSYPEDSLQRRMWPAVDPLDSVLWAWTDVPTQKASGKGELVQSELRMLSLKMRRL